MSTVTIDATRTAPAAAWQTVITANGGTEECSRSPYIEAEVFRGLGYRFVTRSMFGNLSAHFELAREEEQNDAS